jgi:putative copper resistance protein D
MIADALTRWVSLVALAVLVGSVTLSSIALRETSGTVRRRLPRWSRLAAVLLLVAGAGELILRARVMAGSDLGGALAAVPAVLGSTHFGHVWITRALALCVLPLSAGRSGAVARGTTVGLVLGIALSTSLVGHAADHGDVSLATLVDWLHVSAATAWVGGLFCLVLLLPLPATDGSTLALVRGFSTLAGWCLALVVASGVFNGWVEVSSLHALRTTAYGQILLAKVALVLGVVGFGATNRYRILPRIAAGPGATSIARLARSVACEAALGLVVLGCTALLTQSSPPRHRGDDGAAASTQSSVCFASVMTRAHESGQALQTTCVSACLRHSFSQSSQTSPHAAANSPRRDAPSVASSATAPHAALARDAPATLDPATQPDGRAPRSGAVRSSRAAAPWVQQGPRGAVVAAGRLGAMPSSGSCPTSPE